MEEGLKLVISADASEAVKAFSDASNAAKQTEKTWREFVGERMGSYMKQFGGHGPAIKQIASEWQAYKASLGSVSPVQNQVAASAASVAAEASKAFDTITGATTRSRKKVKELATSITESLTPLQQATKDYVNWDKVAANALDRINAKIDENAKHALELSAAHYEAAQSFLLYGRKPLQDIEALKNAVNSAKNNVSAYSLSFVSANERIAASNRLAGQSFGQSTSGFKKGSNEATQAMINLSRVAQDAPYGFIGIANNINPLLESFQRLKATSGSTGGALKALGSSLLGAGGLGLAVGVISSLLVVFGDKLFGTGRAAKSAKESLDDYVDSLNDVDQARVKGLQTAQEELVKLQALYGATQNANIPIKERKRLVDELQDQYPKYFKNISDETILAGGAKKAYDELAGAIIAAAKARAAQDSLVEVQKQILAIDEKIATNLKEQEKARAKAADAQKSIGVVTGGGTAQAVNIDNRELIANRELNKVVASGNNLLKQKNELNERANNLAKFAQSTVQQNPNALLNPTGNLPKDDAPKKQKDANKELKKALQEKKDILLEFQKDFEVLKLPLPDLSKSLEDFKADELTKELSDKLNKALLKQPLKLTVPAEVHGIDLKNPPRPLKIQQSIDVDLQLSEDFQKKMKSFVEGFNNTVKDAIVNGIAGFAEGIGQALVGGDFSQVFKNIAGVMGDLLEQLGKMLIKEAIQIQIFKEALYKWAIANPALAIAAGAGLIIAGAAIKKAALPQPKKFATGGFVPGSGNGDTVPAMLTPGEFVVTKRFAPLAAMLFGETALGGGRLPLHFATGGSVPQVTQSNFQLQPIEVRVNGELRGHGNSLVAVISETQRTQRRSF